ncbi:MAG TPA: hypothetical protein GXZ87_07625 [Bacteroidales bacterium]|nr:hypothetical protein [Bacteroidales bacterium]
MLQTVINYFKKLRIRFQGRDSQLQKAIKKADKLHKKNGKRYRVFFFGNRYHVWTRKDIREKQHFGLLRFDKKCGKDFDKICFYDTGAKKGGKPCS